MAASTQRTSTVRARDSGRRRLVENMMSINSFVEIKESTAAPRYPSVLVAICALAVYSLSVRQILCRRVLFGPVCSYVCRSSVD